MSEVVRSNPLAFASAPNGKCFMSMHTVFYRNKNGQERPYFMCTRGDSPDFLNGGKKRPEAVVVVAVTGDGKLVLTNEFRVPIGGYEISFPSGLIDEDDYKGVDTNDAACRAAIREFKEETGMDFVPKEVSPVNLYSSAGMTDESVCIVIGEASGEPDYSLQEASEDIEVMLLQRDELSEIMAEESKLFSKVAWPFLWAFKVWGMPNFEDQK